MNANFSGRRIMVTGAGKGIGRAVAQRLAREGAWIIAISRTAEDLVSLRAEIGGEAHVADLGDPAALAELATWMSEVDFLVNNAGISIPQPFLETTAEAFDRTLAINVRAPLLLSQQLARQWIAHHHPGAIVNVSSQASMAALKDHAAYCASKA